MHKLEITHQVHAQCTVQDGVPYGKVLFKVIFNVTSVEIKS